MNTLGWLIWGICCVLLINELFQIRKGGRKAFVAVFLSIFIGAALALTCLTPISKFHLLWFVPAVCLAPSTLMVVALLLGFFNIFRARRAASKVPPMEMPPFGKLTWTEYDWWEGKTRLPAWAGFQSCGGPYGAQDSDEPSDGSADLNVTPPESASDHMPTEAQRKALQFQLDHGPEVVESVLNALLPAYQEWKKDWASDVDDEMMPAISSKEQFRRLMGLGTVYVQPSQKDGMAYIGLGFGCDWDEEHGFGVMLHGSRVVDIGQSDTAFDIRPDEAEDP